MTPLSPAPVAVTDGPDFPDRIRRLLMELSADLPSGPHGYSAECCPPIDVFETAAAVEIVLDAPGLSPDSLRVALHEDVVLIVGDKRPGPAYGESDTCHLLERESGRFGRAVRLGGAFDMGSARATLRNGELSIVIPRLAERRGRLTRIPIEVGPGVP